MRTFLILVILLAQSAVAQRSVTIWVKPGCTQGPFWMRTVGRELATQGITPDMQYDRSGKWTPYYDVWYDGVYKRVERYMNPARMTRVLDEVKQLASYRPPVRSGRRIIPTSAKPKPKPIRPVFTLPVSKPKPVLAARKPKLVVVQKPKLKPKSAVTRRATTAGRAMARQNISFNLRLSR